jgi:hypothetical protein
MPTVKICFHLIRQPKLRICKQIYRWLLESVSILFNLSYVNHECNYDFSPDTPLSTSGFWTSGTYVLVVNQYLWASIGQYFTVINWAAGSPVAATQAPNAGGTCVQVGANSFTTNLRWTESACTASLPFICQ